MKPGKKTYVTSIPKKGRRRNFAEKQYFVHNIVVPNREEDIPIFAKLTKNSKKEREFNKPKSEYKDWREDQEEDGAKCIEHDIALWNCERFVKDPEQLKLLENTVKSYGDSLKNIFI